MAIDRIFRSLSFFPALLVLGLLALVSAGPAAAQAGSRMWQIQGLQNCLDVPASDFRPGVQLVVWRCQGSPNQYFAFEEDGHFVANGGQPNGSGQKLCVETDGASIFLQVCRRLTTGDRQYWSRDGWGFIQDNHRGNPECIGIPNGNVAQGAKTMVRSCADNQHASWNPAPTTAVDDKFDDTLRTLAARVNAHPNAEPNYDPEARSRWEDNVRAYGPYHQVKDSRTGLCLIPGQLLSNLILGSCGSNARFHLSPEGLMREVNYSGHYYGVTGRCLQAPGQQGGLIALGACNAGNRLQRWWVFAQGQVQSQGAGNYCLDIKNAATASGSVVIGWPCDPRRPPNQAFRIVREDRFTG